jgi:glycosyltransferase involved in cell wall biosynthesis
MILSVIVSAYSLERFHDLADVIDGISNQTYNQIETIIIIDENKELFDKVNGYINVKNLENVHTIFNSENKGLSHSRNIGIKSSHGSIIAFIDDDAVPSIDWAKNIVETFNEDSLIGAVTGDVIPQWECSDMAWFPRELYWMLSCSYVMTPKEKKEFERGFGTNMAFKRNIFDKVGIFDTNLGINGKKWVGGEDSDMFLKVKKGEEKVRKNRKK